MKKTAFWFLAFLFLSGAPAQAQLPDSLKTCLDSTIAHMQRYSLYRNDVDWPKVSAEAFQLAASAQHVLDLRPAFRHLLGALHDTHGRFFFQNKPIAWYPGDPTPYQQTFDPKVWGAVQSGKYTFQRALLPGNVGYLRIVGIYTQGDNARQAAPIQQAVCALQAEGADRWIIDLRYNGGGNMFPMLGGIAGLIGDGEIGGSMDATGNRFSTWNLVDGDVFYNRNKMTDMENICPPALAPQIAVLTSRYTVSSGEVVATSLKGRPNTRFFGEKTAGLTTETNWFPLPAGVVLSISMSYYVDREGRVYTDSIPVDEPVEFVPDVAPEQDAGVKKAMEWLKK